MEKLNKKEIIEVSPEIENDHIVSIEDAAVLKNVSSKAIYEAIKRGELDKVNGVTLSSLKNYKVMKGRKKAGKIRMKKKKENDLKIEKAIEKGSLVISETEIERKAREDKVLEQKELKKLKKEQEIIRDLKDLHRLRQED